MAQVAHAAGVSVMTVSYVYSRPDRVSPDAATRVRAAAAELGYPGPHPGARSLRRGRAGSLGVVLGERLTYAFDDPQAARFLSGVAEVCAARAVGLTLVPTTGEDSDTARVADAAVDGFVLWTTTEEDPVLDAVTATGMPAVIHAGPARPGLPVVGIDDRAAAAAIGRVSFAGARRPAVLSFPLDRDRDRDRQRQLLRGPVPTGITFPVTRHRWQGFADAWTSIGGGLDRLRVAVCPHNNAAHGEALTRKLLADDEPPDAIAAMSDELALGALRAVERAGMRVPIAVSVTGWDDSDAAAPAGLTTLAQSLRDQGIRCAQIVLGKTTPTTADHRADWHVVHRRSTRSSPL
ncbi:MAG: LacI family DNA-binding transcriptional regulator [Actinoallomurus sp.]